MADHITPWVHWMRSSGTPETTVSLRRYYIQRLHESHPDPFAATVDDLAEWLSGHGWAPNTMKSARSSLRSFFAWAKHTGRIAESPAHLLPPVRIPRARPRPTPEVAYRRALQSDDERVRLAVQLGGQCGLRRGEIARVHVDDIERDLIGYTLRVVGKGGHIRVVPLPESLAAELLECEGYAFPSPIGGHMTGHHLSKLIRAALGTGHTTHSLRHRAATMAYHGTRDLRSVQELLGHSRPETTAGYVAVRDESIRAAMEAAA